MESCLNTERDIDKLLNKFTTFKSDTSQKLSEVCEQVMKLHEVLSNTNDEETVLKSHQLLISQQNKKSKVTTQKLSSQHKELHSSVSRIGKTIDRNFDAECNCVSMPEILNDQEHQKLLNTALCEHFFRQGSFDVAESLARECSLEFDEKWREPYIEMKEIMQSLKNKNVDMALAWAEKNEEQLAKYHSDFKFKLHRLKFLQLLEQGSSHQGEALQYSRKFQSFANDYKQEIQQLMGCFLYIKQGLSKSPYASFFSENVWEDICTSFSHQACRLIGMSVNSPLVTSFDAGCQALPALVAIKSVIEQRQCSGLLTNSEELPIDVDLDNSQHYHSVFACPILRQPTSSKNPPMRLICGHVISKDALEKLTTGTKLKCPYCPVEQLPGEAKQIFY